MENVLRQNNSVEYTPSDEEIFPWWWIFAWLVTLTKYKVYQHEYKVEWNKKAEKKAESEITLLSSATFPSNSAFK